MSHQSRRLSASPGNATVRSHVAETSRPNSPSEYREIPPHMQRSGLRRRTTRSLERPTRRWRQQGLMAVQARARARASVSGASSSIFDGETLILSTGGAGRRRREYGLTLSPRLHLELIYCCCAGSAHGLGTRRVVRSCVFYSSHRRGDGEGHGRRQRDCLLYLVRFEKLFISAGRRLCPHWL